jgi:hypothetical protein
VAPLDPRQRDDVYQRVQSRGGWDKVSSRQVERIAREVAPGTEVVRSLERGDMPVVTTGGRVGPSPRAKGRVLNELREMAEEADLIQGLGPYAVADSMRLWTPEERYEAHRCARRVGRVLASLLGAAREQGFDWSEWHEDDGAQQALPIAS